MILKISMTSIATVTDIVRFLLCKVLLPFINNYNPYNTSNDSIEGMIIHTFTIIIIPYIVVSIVVTNTDTLEMHSFLQRRKAWLINY